MKKRIVIIDGNSLINRAYYAMQRPMMTKDGIYTQAIYGFINMLNRILDDHHPEYIAVAWDLKAPTFRHHEYAEYKAGRKKMPMELAMELPYMKEILEAMNIANLSMEGYEADDIIGTISLMGEEAGLAPLIITGDKDALQLASQDTQVLITRKGISEFDLYDYDKMLERYELTPTQFIDLKGLMGDQSDNIPGIPGVGEKTGINLLKEFGDIDNLLENTDKISSAKLREKVEENGNLARLSRRLAEIQRNVPLDIDIESLKRGEPDLDRLVELYSKLEFNSFLKKLNLVNKSTDENGPNSEDKTKQSKIIGAQDISIEEIQGGSIDKAIKVWNKSKGIVIKVFSDDSHIDVPAIFGIMLMTKDKAFYIHGSDAIKETINYFNENPHRFIGHGLVRDGYALAMNGLISFDGAYDTEIGAYLLDPSRSGYSIKAMALENVHMDIPEEKELEKKLAEIEKNGTVEVDDRNYLKDYGTKYCAAVQNLIAIQQEQLEEDELYGIFEKVEMPLVKVFVDMEATGFTVEEKTLAKQGTELSKEIDQLSKEIYNLAGEEFNINSPKQLGVILFEKIGLKSGKKTKSGYSTSADVLEKLREDHEIIPLILRYRTLSKLNSTYVEGLIPLIGKDQKIRANFRQTVTATGRISCTDPNLQNIPVRNEYGRLIRKAFVPSDKNHILIGADYSQIELRVLAHLSEDQSLIDAFNNGDDIHRATAARVFDIPYDEVTPGDRSRAKAVNFGVIYGMSGFGLSEELGITREEAESFIKDYFDKHPKVKEYMDNQIKLCKERGYTETILGRRRYIPEITSSNYMVRSLGERLAMNSPIQGSAADIIKVAMRDVHNELISQNLKSKLILQVHDELIIDALIEEREAVEKLLIDKMMQAMDLKVELVSELNTANSWYDLK